MARNSSPSSSDVMTHGYENTMPGFDEGLLLPAEQPEAWLEHLRRAGYPFQNVVDAYRPVTKYRDFERRGRTYPPPRYTEADCQTAFLTTKTKAYIDAADDGWFVHLSYLRPHPPFIAPEPYNRMYDPEQVPLPIRAPTVESQASKHPWLASALGPLGDWFDPWMQQLEEGDGAEREIRQIRATYYGLVSKVDHYVGELLDFLRDTRRFDDTLIVITSDHGELLGDQWLFGKRGYFDSAYYIPLIVRDPRQPVDARARVVDAFTESVDVMPTILEWLGLPSPRQCDGRSLLPWVHGGTPADWRSEVHWEYDFRDVERTDLEGELRVPMDHCLLNVIRDRRFKYVHFAGLQPLFFDLRKDPAELHDLAQDPSYASSALTMASRMLSWRMANDERELTGTSVSRERIYTRPPTG